MAKFSNELDQTFSALSDPTRRAILSRLCVGPASVSELSNPFDLALPTFLKHVRILERSGLITTHKKGRVRTCSLDTATMKATTDWLNQHIQSWEGRLDRMDIHIQEKKTESVDDEQS